MATSRERAELSRSRLVLAIAAMAVGGFGIGTTEFVTMGLLPDIASGVDISIPRAGNAISAYALGVVVGAPLIAAVGATWPRRAMLIGLMVLFAVGNVASALAAGPGTLVAARFVAGLPHGAYFGVAALVAASLVPERRRARAIAGSMLGLPIANVVGVPAATWFGQQLGWRSAYLAIAAACSRSAVCSRRSRSRPMIRSRRRPHSFCSRSPPRSRCSPCRCA